MSNKKILDVVVQTTPNNNLSEIKNPFKLCNNIYIDTLSRELYDRIFEACEPPGYGYSPDCRVYRQQLYSFVHYNPPSVNNFQWDSDQRLQRCIALSRIIHPTSISFKYAARVIKNQDDSLHKIIPGLVSGPGAHAFVVDTDSNYLTKSNAEDLKKLIETCENKPLKDPITRAMWYLEYAFRCFEVDVRWNLVAIGLEALIHTDRHSSTKQFVQRVPKLSKDVGAGTIEEADAEEMYDLRSSLAHGQGLGDLTPNRKTLYEKMETILRLTIRKSILEQSFNYFLSDKDEIRNKWPICNENNKNKKTRGSLKGIDTEVKRDEDRL